MDISKLDNISDGVKDGFALFYIKDSKLCSVLLTQEQAEMLNLTLYTVFHDKPARIVKVDSYEMMKYIEREGEK